MSVLLPEVGDTVRLVKFPPNRGVMDWDRVLTIHQPGHIVAKNADDKKRDIIYLVWFSSRNGKEGWEVWLTHEHFTVRNKDDK